MSSILMISGSPGAGKTTVVIAAPIRQGLEDGRFRLSPPL